MTVTVAAVMMESRLGDVAGNLSKTVAWVQRARENRADVACFPELNITGYGIRPDDAGVAEQAEKIAIPALRDLAATTGVFILAGMPVRGADGRLFAAHLHFSPDGAVGAYRKIHIAPPEKRVFSPGNDLPLFKTAGLSAGIQLCYDVHFPELSTRMALDGADILFLPHASPRGLPKEKLGSWLRHLTARAFDNAVFVVACNAAGENGRGLYFPGVAVAVDPSGRIVGEKTSAGEDMFVVRLDTALLAAVRNHRMRYFLPNRRNDLFPIQSKKPGEKS